MDPFFPNNQNFPFGFGLGMLIMHNKAAKDRFDSLNDDEKREFIERSRSVSSEEEMKSYVDSLI